MGVSIDSHHFHIYRLPFIVLDFFQQESTVGLLSAAVIKFLRQPVLEEEMFILTHSLSLRLIGSLDIWSLVMQHAMEGAVAEKMLISWQLGVKRKGEKGWGPHIPFKDVSL